MSDLGWLRNLPDGCGFAGEEIERLARVDERIAAVAKELAELKRGRKASIARVEARVLTQWTAEELAAAKAVQS